MTEAVGSIAPERAAEARTAPSLAAVLPFLLLLHLVAALAVAAAPAAAQCEDAERAVERIEGARSLEEIAALRTEAARCYLRDQRWVDVWRVLAPLVEGRSRGREWAEATQFLGDALLQRGLYLRAAESYLAVASEAEDGAAVRRANESVEAILPALERGERHYLLWRYPDSAALCDTRAGMAEATLAEGDLEEVLRLGRLSGCADRRVAADRISAALTGASSRIAARAGDDFYSVGVIAPLSGDLARYGEALSQGVSLAIEEHNSISPIHLAVRVADTRSDAVYAAAVAESLAAAGVGAVIGPLLSSSTLVAAAALRPSGTVLLSPAAVDERIGLVGPHVFQSVVPRRLQGITLAGYAVKTRGWKRVASLSPDTEDGQALARAFTGRARELGAEIVVEDTYTPGKPIFSDALRDAIEGQADVLFAGGDGEDLVELVSQLGRRGGGIALLGPESIGQPEVLAATAGLPGEAAYVEDYYLLSTAREQAFLERYRELYGTPPDRFARHGYVAATLLAQAFGSGAYSRRSLRERLSEQLGGDPYLRERRILEPDPQVATVAIYRVERGEVVRAEP